MTATPSSDSDKFGRALRKAGNLFGFDLSSLFEDDGGESTGGFEGFVPGFRVQSLLKGRSPSTLTYKAEKTPARTGTFELTPEKTDTSTKAKADRLLSSFIENGTPGAIGAMAVGRAKEYGYTPEQIKSMAKKENLKFGEQAAKSLGLNTNLFSYTSGAGVTPGALGMTAVTAAREAGLADEAIRSFAQQQNLKFGDLAAKSLNVGAGQTYQAPAQQSRTIGSFADTPAQGGTLGAIGLTGINRAASALGITPREAAKRALAEGTRLGDAARALLG